MWLPAVQKVALDGLRVHDLRHTAATMAAALDDLARDTTSAARHETEEPAEGTTEDPAAGGTDRPTGR
jgi:integrase